MRDYIFLIGPSGVGKTTLAKRLFAHYRSVYVEQSMIPEFETTDGSTPMNGLLEEETCWTGTIALLQNFHRLGYKNVLGLDFDDLRTAEIPIVFKGTDFITIKLICSDYAQNLRQMEHRGDGLIDTGLLRETTAKINVRPPLINEVVLDIAGLSAEQVAAQAVALIDTTPPLLDYEYNKPPKEQFYSWVWANSLRTL